MSLCICYQFKHLFPYRNQLILIFRRDACRSPDDLISNESSQNFELYAKYFLF